jgi:uncharacterized OsmC-like protein
MADIESHTVNEEKFFATSRVGDFELSIDSTGEDGPTPNETLVAAYASCYTAAFRAGGQREHDVDVGRLEIDAEANLDDDDDLTDVSFTLRVEADLDDRQAEEMVGTANDICHVHAAVHEGLHADVDVVPGAF